MLGARICRKRFLAIALFVVSALALAASHAKLPFGAWRRVSATPIISPEGDGWEAAGTFNPAVVMHGDRVVMLYRAQDKQGTSRLGYAESSDGVHFTRHPEPVLSPDADYEKDGGVEDPRLVKFGDIYYLTYTGYNTKDAQLCLATSKDLLHWERKGVILPAYKGNWNVGWTKSGAIVPEKIDGKYWMYFLGHECRQERPDGAGLFDRSYPLDGSNEGACSAAPSGAVRLARGRARPAAAADARRYSAYL